MLRTFAPVALLCLIVWLALADVVAEANATVLEERIASLEENLTFVQRQLDVALKRSSNLLQQVEELERTIDGLRANLSKLRDFAAPSPPPSFYVESIRRASSGNYTVTLRWKANPKDEDVTRYAVWYARSGEEYVFSQIVNETKGGIRKATVPGFQGGEQIIFKIFAQNGAGQGNPSYREARIQPYSPFLMSRLRWAGAVAGVLVVALVVWWYLRRRKAREKQTQ